jgi:hypothetical protein
MREAALIKRLLRLPPTPAATRQGCQKVAGGRRRLRRRPPGNALKGNLHPGRGGRTAWCIRRRESVSGGGTPFWHPCRGALRSPQRSGGRSGGMRNDHRLPSGNPAGLLKERPVSRAWANKPDSPKHHQVMGNDKPLQRGGGRLARPLNRFSGFPIAPLWHHA